MELKKHILTITQKAKEASRTLPTASSNQKNAALVRMAEMIEKNSDMILEENKKDLSKVAELNLSAALIDRLTLNESRIHDMAEGLLDIAGLADPVGEITRIWKRPNGLQIGKMRVPLGVVCVIYESRPNVTADVSGLTLKSGNSVILRGGSEALNSNLIIGRILKDAAASAGLPENCIQIVDTTEREAVNILLKLDTYIDVVVPRGGEALIRMVTENSTIPVIKHFKGVCHTYIDEDADLSMAGEIALNAKVQRPGVCNAMETLLVHKDIAQQFLPDMIKRFIEEGVEIRGCKRTREIASQVKPASEDDWDTEYLDLILSVKIVDSLEDAIEHIFRHGSGHSEAIVTKNYEHSLRFLREVDASAVFVNASTRFNDGNQFGLGAEIGISTQKLHVRGPMGLEDLTSLKYIVLGNGQVRN